MPMRATESVGTLFIYTDYEVRVLNDARGILERLYPEATVEREWITDLLSSGRLVDQHDWVYRYHCHPLMGGRTSIKVVLPAVHSGHDPYKDLPPESINGKKWNVQEGVGAMEAYREMIRGAGARDARVKAQLADLLLRYCRLDTQAQLDIWRYWESHFASLEHKNIPQSSGANQGNING